MNSKIVSTAALLLSIAISPPVAAESLEDLRQLLASKQCPMCDLSEAGLRLAQLKNADLSGADLSFANLESANLDRANLSGADLTGAVLYKADLRRANLSGANLAGVNLIGADLSYADLTGANLNGANLSGAYMTNATIEDATIDAAILNGVIDFPGGVLEPQDYYRLAFVDARAGNHQGAIEKHSLALQIDPNYAPAYLGRGVSRLQLGDSTSAIADWQVAAQIFQFQGHEEGYQTSQQFIEVTEKAIEESRKTGKRRGGFLGVINQLAPMLLQFLL